MTESSVDKEVVVSVQDREIVSDKASETYWQIVKKQFKKNRLAVWSLRCIILCAITALIADFLANEKPIVCGYNGETYFPVMKEYAVDFGLSEWQDDFKNVTWKDLEYDWVVWPPVPYLPRNTDFLNSQSKGPFDEQDVTSTFWTHWLGTDELGRDVLAGMIHGTRVALLVGIVAMSIAALIGIILGAIAGYFGDDRYQTTIIRTILTLIGLFLAYYYGFSVRGYTMSDAFAESIGSWALEFLISLLIAGAILFATGQLGKQLSKIPMFSRKITVPLDIIISRLIEVMVSIPRLFLIISVSAVLAKPSIFMVMMIIGLTTWTGIARFMRAELLRIRRLEYIEASKALGYSEFRIILRHAIPNALSPVLIAIAFGIASAILIEATLSFIGIGMPAETITWGSMLAMARQTPSAWWLGVFPGLAIFATVTIYNLLGEGLTDAIDPKKKK